MASRIDFETAGAPRTAKTRRGEIAYWELGEGTPVLCLHGFPDHPAGMMPLVRALAASGHRVVCPALPGYWPSSAVEDGDYAVGAVADDLLEVLTAIGLERVSLVGHDWGASIGYYLGARHPERLSSLVALGAPHPAGFELRREVFSEQRTAWYALLLAFTDAGPVMARNERWLTALVQSWSPGFHWPQWPEIARLLAEPGVAEAVCDYYRADLVSKLDLKPVRVPATVIYGGQDGCIRPIAYAGLDRWFERGLDAHLVPTVGHWPHLEDESAVVPLIQRGLK